MSRKLADDLIHKNSEYSKLKSDRPDDETPRENPDHQGPGRAGLARPELEAWTTQEIRDLASSLNIRDNQSRSRGADRQCAGALPIARDT